MLLFRIPYAGTKSGATDLRCSLTSNLLSEFVGSRSPRTGLLFRSAHSRPSLNNVNSNTTLPIYNLPICCHPKQIELASRGERARGQPRGVPKDPQRSQVQRARSGDAALRERLPDDLGLELPGGMTSEVEIPSVLRSAPRINSTSYVICVSEIDWPQTTQV